MPALSRSARHWIMLGTVGAIAVAAALAPRVAQDLAYHDFADRRPVLGIPNGLDVLSNLPFLIFGIWGMVVAWRGASAQPGPYDDPWERWPYIALFAGATLTAFGSAYYHLAPDNARLVWDRLPMTLGFMGLLTAIIAERASIATAKALFVPLLALGAASVAYWAWTERRGSGDLRPYAVVQFGSMLVMVLLLVLYPSPRPGLRWLVAALGAYLAAKALEALDRPVLGLGEVVSGHSLKHVAAALAVAFLVLMLRSRMDRAATAAGARAAAALR